VSILRIRSEHGIGFLKGRCQSLKRLRLRIIDEKSHKFATYWIAACIGVHSFALQCEDEERRQNGDDWDVLDDPFINEGLSSSSDSDHGAIHRRTSTRLQAGKEFREKLKRRLFRAKERRRQQV
jgi:hypothetical protein